MNSSHNSFTSSNNFEVAHAVNQNPLLNAPKIPYKTIPEHLAIQLANDPFSLSNTDINTSIEEESKFEDIDIENNNSFSNSFNSENTVSQNSLLNAPKIKEPIGSPNVLSYSLSSENNSNEYAKTGNIKMPTKEEINLEKENTTISNFNIGNVSSLNNTQSLNLSQQFKPESKSFFEENKHTSNKFNFTSFLFKKNDDNHPDNDKGGSGGVGI